MKVRGHNKYLYLFLLFVFSTLVVNTQAQSFSFTISPSSQCFSSQSSSNSASAFIVNTSTATVTNYTWTISSASCNPTFTNSALNGSVINVSYPCCGTYTFNCTALNGSTVVTTATAVANVNCPPVISITANTNICVGFSASLTVAGAQSYTWSNGATSSVVVVSPTVNTTYGVVGVNSFGCKDSITQAITVTPSVSANFMFVQSNISTVNFTNTSTGTVSGTTYTWNYGDGTTGMGFNSPHTYSSTGQFPVTLTASNGSACLSTITKTVSVNGCNLVSNFTHTLLNDGVVEYSSMAATTSTNSKYYWNFGDGIFSIAASPTHSYVNAGTYLVTLKLQDTLIQSCFDSLTQSINVTGVSCIANSNFSIAPTFSPQYYTATPAYPYNITSAVWYWGDGTSTPGLYASKLYTIAANYSICLSVTVSCGSTSYSCFNNYLNKSSDYPLEIISINVLRPEISTGMDTLIPDDLVSTLFPNPSTGIINLNANDNTLEDLTITVFSLLGETIYYTKEKLLQHDLTKQIDLSNVANGIYFIKLGTGNKSYTKKIIINK